MTFRSLLCWTALAAAPVCSAQQWEVAAMGGFGTTWNTAISNGDGSVSAGLRNGPVFGAAFASNDYRLIGGEVGYLWRQGGLKLRGGGQEPDFGGHAQFADFRILLHFAPKGARIRPFVAAGGGLAVYTGSGAESSGQPLNSFAALTHTRQTELALSVAAGVKGQWTRRLGWRLEARDYLTPFPDRVIAPAPGTSGGGWLHNSLLVAGIVVVF